MAARSRRNPSKTSPPYLVGRSVGRTGFGLVAGVGRPSSLGVPHGGIFVSWRDQVKYSPRGEM